MNALNTFSPVAHWLPRLSLAATFLYHAAGKFPIAADMAQMLGWPVALVYLLACAEITGALLILYGGIGPDWATRLGGLIFAAVMLGAIFMVHLPYGFNSVNLGSGNMGKGFEFQLLILAVSLLYAFKGNALRDGEGG